MSRKSTRNQVKCYRKPFDDYISVTKQINKGKKKREKKLDSEQEDEIDCFLDQIDNEQLTHEEFLQLVRKKCKSLARKKNDPTIFVQNYILEKSCETCGLFKDDEHLLLCDFCDDAYHTYCLNPPLKEIPNEDTDWQCPVCAKQQEKLSDGSAQKKQKRQSLISEHFQAKQDQSKQNKKQENKVCNSCGKFIICNYENEEIELAEEFDNCIKCKYNYHRNCFNSKKNSIVCKNCEFQIKKELPQTQTSIRNYFQALAKANSINNFNKINKDELDVLTQHTQKLRLSSPLHNSPKKKKTIYYKKSHYFKLPAPLTPEQQIQQTQSFIYALKAKNIEFDDDLRFTNVECPPSKNDTKMEPNLQKLSLQNYSIFKLFKEMTRQCHYPPVVIEEDKIQGFVVRAIDNIPELTLICEYVGEVDYARNRVFDQNDSIMDLLRTARSSTTLVICPEKFGNIARFISGINNSCSKSKQKQNVQSARFDIDGHARVILYAKRNIKKGELLFYDYNAGGFGEYPTENFI